LLDAVAKGGAQPPFLHGDGGLMLRRVLLSLALVAVPLLIVAFVLTAPKSISAPLPPYTPNLANGRVMFEIGGCASCHATPNQPDRTRLGGGLALKTRYGVFYPPNISPDPEHGIGRWSPEQFVSAMHEGTSPQGSDYYPAFPYPSYAKMRLEDVRDLFAYLKMLPQVSDTSKPHDLRFPYSLRFMLRVWKALSFDNSFFQRDPSQSPEWNRGAYLVNGPGHCAECHSPRNWLGAIVASRRFTGGPDPTEVGKVPSLTQANLDIWSVKDIETLLATGKMPDGDKVGGSMADVVKNTAQLSPEDRHTIAVYVKSLKAVEGEPKPP
jgi:mono/diheme cytochrome c family protein